MIDVSVKTLLEAGAHFGHRTWRWNPKMKDFIYGEKNGIHIIDVEKTLEHLQEAYEFVCDQTAEGKKVLMVGTKRQAKDIIFECAEQCNAYYVTNRWLGGMLTNFRTIKKTIARMLDYEKMEIDGRASNMPKKEALKIHKERIKLNKYLNGIKDMTNLPDILFIIDIKNEDIAYKEALKLRIPVVAIVDTNIDPDNIDYPIPGNDDATRSINLFTSIIAAAIEEGNEIHDKLKERAKEEVMIEKSKVEEDKDIDKKVEKIETKQVKKTVKKATVKKVIKKETIKTTKKTETKANEKPKKTDVKDIEKKEKKADKKANKLNKETKKVIKKTKKSE